MVNLRVLVPEATTNYILNPALRYDTTGWTAYGSTISRSMDQARFGIASLKVITSGLVIREGTYYRVSALTGVSEPITVSAYVRGEIGNELVHIRLIDNPAGKEWVSPVCTLRNDRWTRIEVSGFSTGANDMRLYVETDGTARAVTFYVDGAQMERKAYSTSYCDGNQSGCQWNIVDHGSISTRSAYTRAGGRWVPLSGPCRGDTDVYTTVVTGLAMPPIGLNIQPWALAAGSYLQSSKVEDRSIGITFHLKREGLRLSSKKPDLSMMYTLRQQLIDLFKPDRTIGDEPFCLEYDDGERPLRIWVHYDGGLEGSWDVRNQWTNGFMLRLLAVDPFWEEDSQSAKALGFQNSYPYNYGAAIRMNGEWNFMNFCMDEEIYGFATNSRGEIYAVGAFTLVNNNANAVDPFRPAKFIARWDGTKWNALGNGACVGSIIDSIWIDASDNVYVGGIFTSIGGVAANNIAMWNGSAWSALGTGTSGGGSANVLGIVGDNEGNVYIAGDFEQAGGINAYAVARWDGAWHQMGPRRGLNDYASAIKFDNYLHTLYIGGFFTDEYGLAGSALLRICSYDVETQTFSAMGSGFDAYVLDIDVSKNNKVYACGIFTYSGTTLVNKIAEWNGSLWSGLDGGESSGGGIFHITSSTKEELYVSGRFDTIGSDSITAKNYAKWNGSKWTSVDLYLSGNVPDAIFYIDQQDRHLMGAETKALYSAINTVDNLGSTYSIPYIFISGSGRLIYIENLSTQKKLYFNLEVLSGENVVIDFNAQTIMSYGRGSLIEYLIGGSDFGNFTLLPGENKIAVFMVNDVNAKMSIYFTPRHWSVDAVMRPEALT